MMLDRTVMRGSRIVISVAIALSIAPIELAPQPPTGGTPFGSPFRPTTGGSRVAVPSAIDSTGGRDASADLRAFIQEVPDGSTIVFPPGGVYQLQQAIRLEGRHRLVFEGAGTRLEIAGCEIDDSAFVVDRGSSDIVIRRFEIIGDNANGGTTRAYEPGCESQSGVAVYSGRNVEIRDVSIARTTGECVYIDGGGVDYVWTDGVWFHDSTCASNGRMGVAIAAGTRITVDNVRFERIGMFVLDIEPYQVSGGATFVTFRDNTVVGYGMTPLFTNWFVAAEGVSGSLVEDLVVTRNSVLAGAPRSANTITQAGLATTIRVERRRRIAFTDNTTTVAGDGPALYFSHIDGLIVSGNVQPLDSGDIARFVDCSSVRFNGIEPST